MTSVDAPRQRSTVGTRQDEARGGATAKPTTATAPAALDQATTRALLHDVPGVYRTQVNDVLLAALARTLARWTGRDRVLVDLEGHGREEIVRHSQS